MSYNQATIIGNLGKDPKVVEAGDKKVCMLTVATSYKYKNKNGEVVEDTQWHSVEAWGEKLSEICEKYAAKGSQVFITGRLKTDKWDDSNGVSHIKTKIVAQTIKILGRKEQNKENSENDPFS